MKPTEAKVVVLKDGPHEVRGEVPLSRQIIATNEEGGSVAGARASASRYPTVPTFAAAVTPRRSRSATAPTTRSASTGLNHPGFSGGRIT
jgi:hypothetical protein